MNPSQTVQSTLWAAVFIQTIGAVDPPGKGPRKLPAPGQYVAIFAAWSVLEFMASGSLAKGARAMSIVFLLVTLVLGSGGQRIIALMGSIASTYSNAGNTGPGNTGTAAGAPASAPVAPTTRFASILRPIAPSPSATVST
jgi:hypothetical protein